MTLASVFSLIVAVFAACLATKSGLFLPMLIAIAQVILGLVFYWKGKQTYTSLLEQERAVIRVNKELFQKMSISWVPRPRIPDAITSTYQTIAQPVIPADAQTAARR
jgi:hypothetical protein